MSEPRDPNWTITTVRANAVEMPSLRVVRLGVSPEVSVPLGLELCVVGSSDECSLVLDDPSVSRKHCSLRLTDEGIVVRDLGSKNGTKVGPIRVREVVLAPETVITVGAVALTIRIEGGASVVPLAPAPQFGRAMGGSLVMRALFARLAHAATTDESILLSGESGTGKELLAQAIHEASPRRTGPFVVVDCGAIAPHLFEAEFFGYLRGAFTGAETDREGALASANGGTLLLDEVGEIPLDVQPKLLRALETKQRRPLGTNHWSPVNVRVVAATHRDLRTGVREGTFRSDLYYRLAVIEARVPPLRERGDDLELLVEHLLSLQVPPRTVHDLPPNAMAMLKSHDFPGNVRELRNVLTRWTLFPELGEEAFEQVARGGWETLFGLPLRDAREQVVERFESDYLAANLRAHAGNVTRTAQSAGVSRTMIYRLLERYGIKPSKEL